MTIVATYDDTEELGRVRLSFSGFPGSADYATVERSTDNITWETIRGGSLVGISSGAGAIDDYEFTASVVNYYRVRAVDNAAITVGAVGAVGSAVNASVTPGTPASIAVGDVVLLFASIRNSGTGTVNLPSGWTAISGSGTNYLIAGKELRTAADVSGFTNPTVTFTGGAAGADTLAVMFPLHNAALPPTNVGTPLLNSSAQNVITPAFFPTASDMRIRAGWKQDDSTGMPAPAGYTTVMSVSSSAGDDASMAAVAGLATVTGAEGTATITWDGGAAAISRGHSFSIPKAGWIQQETQTITPTVTRWRIKNPGRPSLNFFIEPLPVGTITRPSKTGLFDVLGRTLPVAVADVAGSRRFELLIDVFGYQAKEDVDRKLATGGALFLQGPSAVDQLPTCYFTAGSVEYEQDATGTGSYTFTISVVEVAKPGPTVFANTTTWADIVAEFATWADLVSAEATWSDVVDRISDSEVIVP